MLAPGRPARRGCRSRATCCWRWGVSEAQARGALRLTLGHTSTEADVDAFLAALPAAVERARRRGRPASDAGRRRDERRGRLGRRRGPDARRRPRGGRRAPRAVASSAATLREGARGCCTIEDAGDARRVADVLGIPFYVWDMASPLRARRRRGLRGRVRRRAHAQPVPALQRADQVRRRCSTRRWRWASTPWPPATTRRSVEQARRAARAAPGRRPRQGPVATSWACSTPTSWPARSSRSATRPSPDPRGGRRARLLRREEARQPRHLLHPRRRHPRLAAPAGSASARRHRRRRIGAVVGSHGGAYAFTVGQRRGLGLDRSAARRRAPLRRRGATPGPTGSSSAPPTCSASTPSRATTRAGAARRRRASCGSGRRCAPTARRCRPR